jgi:hypothetical protein
VFDTFLHSDGEIILFAVPFICILLMSFLRLDELIGMPKPGRKLQRTACGLDRDGEPVLCDPDGRTWSRAGRRK